MDPAFGHLAIKMSGHPPFGAQVMLNGHEYVAVAAQGEGIGFTKEGNCFTEIADPQRLARVADAWPRDAAIEIMSHCVVLPWVMGTGSLAAAGGCGP
jgi:hypothetical protein